MSKLLQVVVCCAVTVLSASTRGASLSTFFSFGSGSARYPISGLARDASGDFYGFTLLGGTSVVYTVYKVSSGGQFSSLHTFAPRSGDIPWSAPTIDASGNLYGSLRYGGATGAGSVFRISSAGVFTNLHDFIGADGSVPLGLHVDEVGNVVGTTVYGGASDAGTVFRIGPGGAFETLVAFGGPNSVGAFPGAGVVSDGAGAFYGPLGSYRVFRYEAGTVTVSPLLSGEPAARLTFAGGSLYGTTRNGGSHDLGSVYKMSPSGAIETLASFDGANGSYSFGELLIDAQGNIFGTTQAGGTYDRGTVFRLSTDGILTSLVSFGGPHPSYPSDELVVDANGNLYGTTMGGGEFGYGTIFKVTNTGFVVPEPSGLALLALAVKLARRHR